MARTTATGRSEPTPPAAQAPAAAPNESLAAVLRPVIAFLANVTVISALLVYFGWRRSATQSDLLGVSQAVFGMSTQDYLLRSVRPVLVLLVGVAVAGVLWVLLDRWLAPRVRGSHGGVQSDPPGSGLTTWVLRLLGWAWLVLPALVWLMGLRWRPLAFVLFPASIGVGALLLLYAAHLRGVDAGGDEQASRRVQVLRACGALVAGVCVFWTAANYAHLEGVQLARSLDGDVTQLPAVVLHSDRPLHLEGPGVAVEELTGEEGTALHRYSGLRLLEFSGGSYFLVSDGWSTAYGVVTVLPRDDPGIRVQFLRGTGPAGG